MIRAIRGEMISYGCEQPECCAHVGRLDKFCEKHTPKLPAEEVIAQAHKMCQDIFRWEGSTMSLSDKLHELYGLLDSHMGQNGIVAICKR